MSIGVNGITISFEPVDDAGQLSACSVLGVFNSFGDEDFRGENREVDGLGKLLVPSLNIDGNKIEVRAERVDSSQGRFDSLNKASMLDIVSVKSRQRVRVKQVKRSRTHLSPDSAVDDLIPRANALENLAQGRIRLNANTGRAVAVEQKGIAPHLRMAGTDIQILDRLVAQEEFKQPVFAAL